MTLLEDEKRYIELLNRLDAGARSDTPPGREDALEILTNGKLDLKSLIEIAEIPRKRHYQDLVQIHILNNVKNGSCSEDCSYCVQSRSNDDGSEVIESYPMKPEEEILAEAKAAFESGAFRYCLVAAGKGPGEAQVRRYAEAVKKIKELYPLEVCLSAGILTNPDQAAILAEAGLDRYNHNLNTSMAHYDDICTTHTFGERVGTLQTMGSAGVSLCSGVIVGMGESDEDLIDVAYRLAEHRVASIPVNFFLPIPGHRVTPKRELTEDYCLRVLVLFRLVNPVSEVRMAAGREKYLSGVMGEGLRIASSLFVSGYLNVKGSDAETTVARIRALGYRVDSKRSDFTPSERVLLEASAREDPGGELALKGEQELRPFR